VAIKQLPPTANKELSQAEFFEHIDLKLPEPKTLF
jgi:hypothetical protein